MDFELAFNAFMLEKILYMLFTQKCLLDSFFGIYFEQ